MLSVVSNSHRFYTLFFIHILDGFIYKCTHIMLQTILYRSKILFLYITPSHQHIQLFHSASENVLLKKKQQGSMRMHMAQFRQSHPHTNFIPVCIICPIQPMLILYYMLLCYCFSLHIIIMAFYPYLQHICSLCCCLTYHKIFLILK